MYVPIYIEILSTYVLIEIIYFYGAALYVFQDMYADMKEKLNFYISHEKNTRKTHKMPFYREKYDCNKQFTGKEYMQDPITFLAGAASTTSLATASITST